MRFEIIGSGGCVSLPKPLCQCRVCLEAREKGRPYARFGPSLFLHDINMLIDTPEDIVPALNASSVKAVEHVLYSHMDPDHVLGFRVFEQLRLNWLEVFEGRECTSPIHVYALPGVMEDLNKIHSPYGSYLDYYEHKRQLITRRSVDKLDIDGIQVTFVPVGRATVFVFESQNKKLIYAPCDVKPMPHSDYFEDADIMIIGNSFIGDTLKDGYELAINNPLRQELFSMDEIVALKKQYKIKQVIMTHLEEDWGKSYDDYRTLENSYDKITFAYDGLMIEV